MRKKDFLSLTIRDSFMFYAVMSNPEQCRQLLNLVLDMEIDEVTVHREDTLLYHPDYRGIRLDVIANEKGTRRRFNVEMQARLQKGLEKRTRYYHSQLDMDTLLAGHDYHEIPDTYVIFICDFDPVGSGLYRYSYQMRCDETGTPLEDGTHTIFLSTKGKNNNTVPSELVSFLRYVGNPLSKEIDEDSFVQSVENQILTIKRDREWRNKYMLLELTIADERKEARAEGLAEGRTEGHAEGKTEGQLLMLIDLCCRKLKKGLSVEEIALALEREPSEIGVDIPLRRSRQSGVARATCPD